MAARHNNGYACSDGSVSIRITLPNLNLTNPTISFNYTLTTTSGSTAADMYVIYNGVTQLDKVYGSNTERSYSYTYNGTVKEFSIECSAHRTSKSTLKITNLKINGVPVEF